MEPPAANAFASDAAAASESPAHTGMLLQDDQRLNWPCQRAGLEDGKVQATAKKVLRALAAPSLRPDA